MTEMKREVAIRRYRPGDETTIVALFNEVFSVPLKIHQWEWKYCRPLNGFKCYVAHDRNGRLIGHIGAIGLRGRYKGAEIPVFQICDLMIHPDARGYLGARGLFTRLARTLLADIANSAEIVFAYGFPGRRPYMLGERTRVYERIEQGHELHLVPIKSLTTGHVRLIDWDAPRLDTLWTRFRGEFRLGLIRDRAYLKWRYADNPFRNYRLVSIRRLAILLGWAVVQADGPVLRIIDLLCRKTHLARVIQAMQAWAYREGYDDLVTWLPTHWRTGIQGTIIETNVVTTNMVWRLPLPTSDVSRDLYYTMGDLDIF